MLTHFRRVASRSNICIRILHASSRARRSFSSSKGNWRAENMDQSGDIASNKWQQRATTSHSHNRKRTNQCTDTPFPPYLKKKRRTNSFEQIVNVVPSFSRRFDV